MKDRKRRAPLPEHLCLPPELWREILARSPPKSLLRFRCVCKDWWFLIDSRDFTYMHLNQYQNNSAKTQLLVEEKVPRTLFDFKFTIRRSDTFRKICQLVKSSETRIVYRSFMVHGLMLMDFRANVNSNSYSNDLCLWNPSIRKSLTLPPCPLVFNLFHTRCFLGFVPSDYKVVAFELVDTVALELDIAVYSLRDHLWDVKHRRFKLSRWCYEKLQCRCGVVFVQGVMYWRPSFRRRREETELFTFDFDSEKFSSLKIPDIEEEMYKFLFVFGGSLAFFGISRVRSCIWVLEHNDKNEIWRQCWETDTNEDVYEFCSDDSMDDYQMLYIEDTGTLLVQPFRKLMAYNIRSNQTRFLGKTIPLSYVETYEESLVLHKGFGGAALTTVV